jgi:hypothetical protein
VTAARHSRSNGNQRFLEGKFMQHGWNNTLRRLASAVTLMALLVLMRGMGRAQTLAFQPGFTSVVAGDPANPSSPIASPATYVGPAAGLVAAKGGFFDAKIDKHGNIYLSEYNGNVIRVIASGNGPIPVLSNPNQSNYVANPQAGYVYTVAGTGVKSGTTPNPVSSSCTTATDAYGDGCLATQAVASSEGAGLAVDSEGNVYLADYATYLIRVIYAGGTIPGITTPAPGYIYSIAGTAGKKGYTGDNGLASMSELGQPAYIAVDSNGNVFFDDFSYNVLRVISVSATPLPGVPTPTVGYIYTIVGNTGTLADGIAAATSKFTTANGVAIDSSGNIYVADKHGVRVIYVTGSVPGLSNLSQGNIYSVAGSVTGGSATPTYFTPITATTASISPVAVALDSAGSLYIVAGAGSLSHAYKVDPSGNLIVVDGASTADGSNTCASPVDSENDGCATDAENGSTFGNLDAPYGVALDPQGNIYVPDGFLPVLHEVNVAASSLYFTPGQTQPVVIYNTSSSTTPLTLSDIAVTSPFQLGTVSGSVTACSTATTLQPGESCESSIVFSSSYTGTANATGTLTVASNSSNATDGANVIQLTGESAANAALAATTLRLSTAPSNSITAGAPVTFTYNLSSSSSRGPGYETGTVTLYNNGNAISTQTQTLSGTSVNQTINFSGVTLPTGTNLVYAVYGGDTYYAGSQSGQALVTVNGAATTTALTASPNPAATNSPIPITLTATITSPSGTPSDGTVTFKNGSTVIGQQTVNNGTASVTATAPSTAGPDTFTASYAGSTTYNPSTSSVTVTVQAAVGTATAVGANPTGIAEGASTTLTATVIAASGTTAPTGTVTFSDESGTVGTVTLTPVGTTNQATATYTASAFPVGTHSISAAYSGSADGLFQASSSSTSATVKVGLPATTTTLTASPTSITYGDSVTLTASVAATINTGAIPIGSVTFTAGSTTLGTQSLNASGSAQLQTTNLPGGAGTVNDSVTATYNDPTNTFASSTGTASVSVAPLATITSTPTPSTLNPVSGQPVTLTATVTASGSNMPTGTVTFYNNGTTSLCSAALTSGSASCPFTPQQGSASITAVFVGGNGFATSTSTTPLSLNVAASPAATTTVLKASTSAQYVGQPVTFTATVTTTGTGTPNGIVTFQSATTTLGTGALGSNGQATLTTSTLAAGTYNVIAVYQGNSSYTGSTSSQAVTVVITQALTASTTTLTSSSTAIQQGQNVTFTATVTPNSPITATGNVTFMSGGTTLGQGTLYGGVATYSTAALSPANYNVTAVYAGDANFTGSTSNAVALAVATPTPSFTLTATPSTLTLTSGQTGAAIITLVPTYGYTGSITLSCGTLPANVTCSFSPATLTADGKNDTVQSTLTISTTGAATTASVAHGDGNGRNGMRTLAFLFLPSGLLLWGFAARRKQLGWYLPLLMLTLLTVGLAGVSGCGGGNGGSTKNAAPGTSQIVVTAAGSAGSQSQTVNLAITIQ